MKFNLKVQIHIIQLMLALSTLPLGIYNWSIDDYSFYTYFQLIMGLTFSLNVIFNFLYQYARVDGNVLRKNCFQDSFFDNRKIEINQIEKVIKLADKFILVSKNKDLNLNFHQISRKTKVKLEEYLDRVIIDNNPKEL